MSTLGLRLARNGVGIGEIDRLASGFPARFDRHVGQPAFQREGDRFGPRLRGFRPGGGIAGHDQPVRPGSHIGVVHRHHLPNLR